MNPLSTKQKRGRDQLVSVLGAYLSSIPRQRRRPAPQSPTTPYRYQDRSGNWYEIQKDGSVRKV